MSSNRKTSGLRFDKAWLSYKTAVRANKQSSTGHLPDLVPDGNVLGHRTGASAGPEFEPPNENDVLAILETHGADKSAKTPTLSVEPRIGNVHHDSGRLAKVLAARRLDEWRKRRKTKSKTIR